MDTDSSTNAVAVSCRDVRKHFDDGEARVEVLRGVNFEARLGEITLLVGPSGCGKTTLLSVIAGLLDSNSGEVLLFGSNSEQFSGRRRVAFRRRNLGFVFQQYNLLPALTAVENAAVPLIAAGVKRSQATDQARAVLTRLGLRDRLDALPIKLSGGQQQRVAIARALIHEPRLIVCDEPTAALDQSTGETVLELLASAAVNPHRAVIIVTHDSRVLHFGDAIAYMNDGVITHADTQIRGQAARNTAIPAQEERDRLARTSVIP